jgi:hypothetical protein
MSLSLRDHLKQLLPSRVRHLARKILNLFREGHHILRRQWHKATFLPRLRLGHPEDYQTLMCGHLPERLRQTILGRLAADEIWRCWPAAGSKPRVSADVLFVSYRAHPDLLKQCIALKRKIPGIRCALVAELPAHTQRLCRQWFDEVVVFGDWDEPRLLGYLRNADAKVVVLRYRSVLFNTLARLFRRGSLVYSPPGFYLSSRSGDYSAHADPDLPFADVFEADKFLLEHVDGVIHFLSDAAFEWFRANGVNLRCPAATVHVACMPELEPRTQLPKLSENDGEWHIVHATGVPPVSWTSSMGRDAFLSLEKCREVVSQGIHLHVYGTYFSRNDPGYAPYVDLERRSPYFHIEKQLEFDDLLVAMTQYDYAWKHWDTSGIEIWPAHNEVVPPNFHAYIESGLPLLMSPMGYPAEVRLAREQGVGLFVEEGDLPNLKQILDRNKQNLAHMRKLVQAAKKTAFSYDTQSLLKVVGPYLADGKL